MRTQFVHDQASSIEWLCRKIGMRSLADDAHVLADIGEDGQIIAAVGYDRFSGNDCMTHIAIDPAAGRPSLAFWPAIYAYPFQQLGFNRISSLARADNHRSVRFTERQGFRREGLLREGAGDADLILFGMLRGECRFIMPEWIRAHVLKYTTKG